MRSAAIAAGALAAAMVLGAAPALGASFTATTTPFAGANNCSGVTGGNAATPLSAFATCGAAGLSSKAEAHADYGKVGVMAQASGGANASALASFSDTVRFTSTDPKAVFTSVALQVELSGFLTGSPGPFDFNYPTASATSEIQGQVFFNGSGPLTYDRAIVTDRNGVRESFFLDMFPGAVGDLHAGALDLILVTQTFFVPLNRDISFALLVQAGAGSFGPISVASADFAHTFGLPTGRDVFLLSDGVTANAGDYLVNNRFGATVAGVPEPAAWAAMILGFGLAGCALRGAGRTRRTLSRAA